MKQADAAVAIVYAQASDAVLLMRRTEREDDSWSGHWSFPGGRFEAGDQDLLATALRELDEECGVRLQRDCLEKALPHATARRREGHYLQVAPFVLRVDGELTVTLRAEEAVEGYWAALGDLRDPARHRLQPVPRVHANVLFPAIDLHAVPLWGFTYRLITEWLDLNPQNIAGAGFAAARDMLDAVVALGCELLSGWTERDGAWNASVRGPIPVDEVLAHALRPGPRIPCINRLDVSEQRIGLLGLAFEEYVIHARD